MHIDWAATGAWASFFAVLLSATFVYGRLTQQVKTNTDDIRDLKSDYRQHDVTISRHGTDIALIKQHLELDK
jgi:hypothetical protein